MAQTDSDRPCCMICMESEGPLYQSPCLCRNVLVHADCFARMIQRPNYRSTCAVCRAKYGPAVLVHIEHEIRCLPSTQMKDVVGLWILLIADLYLAVYVTFVTVHAPDYEIDAELNSLMIIMSVCLWTPAFVVLLTAMVSSRFCCCECISEHAYRVNVSNLIMV